MRKSILTVLALGSILGAGAANAVQINGAISMSGGWTPMNGGVATTISGATAIDFDPSGAGGAFDVDQRSGDLAFLEIGDIGTITDFTFSPFAGPINDFYTITDDGLTLTFRLDSLVINLQNATVLVLTGQGSMCLTGFDCTDGDWVFTGQTSAGGQATFSWSATSGATPTPTPEPGSLALLGLGLVGLGVMRRRNV